MLNKIFFRSHFLCAFVYGGRGRTSELALLPQDWTKVVKLDGCTCWTTPLTLAFVSILWSTDFKDLSDGDRSYWFLGNVAVATPVQTASSPEAPPIPDHISVGPDLCRQTHAWMKAFHNSPPHPPASTALTNQFVKLFIVAYMCVVIMCLGQVLSVPFHFLSCGTWGLDSGLGRSALTCWAVSLA